MSFLFGSAPKVVNNTNPTIDPTQQGLLTLLSQLLTSGQQAPGVKTYTGQLAPGAQPLQATSLAGLENIASGQPSAATPAQTTAENTGLDAITKALGYQPPQIDATQAFKSGVVDPLTTNFNTNVLPGIAGRYGAEAGGAFGSDALAARQQAGLNLDQTLAQAGSQYSLGAAQANQSASLAGENSILQALNIAPATIGNLPNAANAGNANLLTSLLTGGGATQYGIQSGLDTSAYTAFTNQQGQNQQLLADLIASFSPQTLSTTSVAQGGQSGLIQGLLQGAASNPSTGTFLTSLLSDERVKTDVQKIGKLKDGQNVYKFRYKGEEPVHVGLLAQEVEKKRPEAVVTHPVTGLKYVNYDLATLLAA